MTDFMDAVGLEKKFKRESVGEGVTAPRLGDGSPQRTGQKEQMACRIILCHSKGKGSFL